jgi:hypothetical protein
MEFKDAVKKVQSSKVKDNFILVNVSYDKKLILPYAQGLAFLAALENAEQFNESYADKKKSITGINRKDLEFMVMSRNEYEQIKIAQLLNVTVDEVKQYEIEVS